MGSIDILGERGLERRHLRTGGQEVAFQDPNNRCDIVVVDGLSGIGKQ